MRIVAAFLLFLSSALFAAGKLTVIDGKGVVVRNGKAWISPRRNIDAFTEIAPTWNVTPLKPDSGFIVSMRLYGVNGTPSPWIRVGEWREASAAAFDIPQWGQSVAGRILLFEAVAKGLQFKLEAGKKSAIRIGKLFAYSDAFSPSRDPSTQVEAIPLSKPVQAVSMPMPFHTQFEISDTELARRSCLPATLSMVLEHFGKTKRVAEVMDAMLFGSDRLGVWNKAVQYASIEGLEGWVQRFRSQEEASDLLKKGASVIASIHWMEKTPHLSCQASSPGHMVVITGISSLGQYIVNDPVCDKTRGKGVVYSKEVFENLWFSHGGFGIVIRQLKT